MGHTETYTYKAFISYSRADEALVVQWMRRLERFRIPGHLAGHETAAGIVPKTLRPIFRDREEFAASYSLQGAIEAALRSSEYMLLFCSPAAANSRWVNEEITLFRRLNGTDKIITIIVDGDVDAKVGQGKPGCLPPALTAPLNGGPAPAVPLGADVRDDGDGAEIALYKVVAGIIGVPLGELQRRHEKRQRRMIMAIACTFSAAAFAFAVLAYTATVAKREAIEQRTEAETLIEFMLGDLREDLVPIGRTDLLADVGKRAITYYEKQDVSKLSDASLGRRARAFLLLGETLKDNTKYNEAATYFELAYASTDVLYKRNPNDYQVIFDHAQSAFWMGDIGDRVQDRERIRKHYIEYNKLTKKLYDQRPNDPQARMEWVWGNTNIGAYYIVEDFQPEIATDYITKAQQILDDLIRDYPNNRTYIKASAANTGRMALITAGRQDWQAALNYLAQQFKTLGRWQPAQRDWGFFIKKTNIRSSQAYYLANLGRIEESIELLNEALEAYEIYTDRNAEDAQSRSSYASSSRLAMLLSLKNNTTGLPDLYHLQKTAEYNQYGIGDGLNITLDIIESGKICIAKEKLSAALQDTAIHLPRIEDTITATEKYQDYIIAPLSLALLINRARKKNGCKALPSAQDMIAEITTRQAVKEFEIYNIQP